MTSRWLVVAMLAALIYLPGAGTPFSNTAESQEALVVCEMVASGDWILPRINDEQLPSKPPLYHWVAIAFSGLTGRVNELALRLPSILSAGLSVGLVFAAAEAEWGTLTGVVSAVVLATSPEWVKWATTARTDATFALFLTAAFLVGERWLRAGRRADLLGLALATGAATLAKGFAAAALVSLVLAAELWRRRAWSVLRARDVALAAAVFIAVACSWYAAALAHAGSAFIHKQIILENVLRFLPYEEGGPSRQHSWLFYVPMLFTGMLPWSVALPAALWHGYRERRGSDGTKHFAGYLVIWFTIVFLVCSAASGKRTNYALPLYPAAAVLIGHEISTLLDEGRSRTLRVIGILSASLLAVAVSLLLTWRLGLEPWNLIVPWLHPQDRVLLPKIVAMIGPPSVAVLAVGIALTAALVVTTMRSAWRPLFALIGSAIVLVTIGGCKILPELETELKSFAPFTERAASAVGHEPLAFFQASDFAVLFYLRRHVAVCHATFATLPRPGWALVWQKDWDSLGAEQRRGAAIVDASPPASVGRAETQLLLVHLS